MKKIKQFIYDYLSWIYRPIKYAYPNYLITKRVRKEVRLLKSLNPLDGPRIYYLGITAHTNLGDMAQHYCISCWINENFPASKLLMFESNSVVRKKFIQALKNIFREKDIVIFQSGYTTTDLGGNHEKMHRVICDNFPNARILMMPQTILFRKERTKKRCSVSYNKAKKMLFLARDNKSFETAKEMFTNVKVKLFPDIVTSLIGTFSFKNKRHGACLCVRNDGEKFYSDDALSLLISKLEKHMSVVKTDTQSPVGYCELRNNKKKYIEAAIESFSKYSVTITDRYHGTIFSLCAGTPVIIIKTTDHKVVTGADWFKGIYDEYVYVAKDLDEAYNLAVKLNLEQRCHVLPPYFKEHYYDLLKKYFLEL